MAVDPTRVEESFPDYSEPIHMGDYRVVDPPNTAAQAKAIDASITAAFYNGMEKAAVISETQVTFTDSDERIKMEIAAAIRAEVKK